MSSDSRLDGLFQAYRASCPEVEASPNFMPALWRKIEARHSFWFVFQGLSRTAMAASAALCVVLLLLNVVSSDRIHQSVPSYMDALMADHTAEKTYYTEAIRSVPPSQEVPGTLNH